MVSKQQWGVSKSVQVGCGEFSNGKEARMSCHPTHSAYHINLPHYLAQRTHIYLYFVPQCGAIQPATMSIQLNTQGIASTPSTAASPWPKVMDGFRLGVKLCPGFSQIASTLHCNWHISTDTGADIKTTAGRTCHGFESSRDNSGLTCLWGSPWNITLGDPASRVMWSDIANWGWLTP